MHSQHVAILNHQSTISNLLQNIFYQFVAAFGSGRRSCSIKFLGACYYNLSF